MEVKLLRRHPGQQRIFDSPARFRVVMCGRRWGKTAFGVREACDAAISGKPVGWFAPNYKYVTEVWRELLGRLGPIIARSNDQERRIELVTGGVIEVWTMDGPDPGLGRKYALIVVDEAGIIPDLLDMWQRALRPTLVDLGGKALFLGTPRGRRHGFVQLFNRGLLDNDPLWASFRASTLDNPYIPPEEIEIARREMPENVFAQEFEGIPTDDGANPFGLEAIRDAVKAGVGVKADNLPVVYGLDLARSMDYTVLVGMDAWRRVVHLERWQAPWAETKARVRRIVGQTPVVADATGVGDAIVADLQAMEVSVTPHVFTQPSKLRLMQRLVAAFQGRELVIPDQSVQSDWLVAELESFEFNYTATGVRYEAPSGLHDDGVMALALALHGWDRVQGVVPEGTPLLRPVSNDPNVGETGETTAHATVVGNFVAQLPGVW